MTRQDEGTQPILRLVGQVSSVLKLPATSSMHGPAPTYPAASCPDPPLHPTAQSQARIAALIEPAVAQAMGDRIHR